MDKFLKEISRFLKVINAVWKIGEKMKNVKTQIYGTFGPACQSQEILEEMIKYGMTGMRLNLSHTTLEKSKEYIENYRNAAKNQGVEPQILIDMQGPELRVGDMEEVLLHEGDWVKFEEKSALEDLKQEEKCLWQKEDSVNSLQKEETKESAGKAEATVRIPIPAEVLKVLSPEMEVLLDDGKIRVRIEKAEPEMAIAKVLMGGVLKAHKSIKIVDVNVSMPVLTEHDLINIRQAKEYGVTALMQPFVFSGEDLKKVRKILKEENALELQIFAKIENRMGVKQLENILPEADLIVIARGDLGNDMPLWELPLVQKQVELTCKKYGKPYMVVTQMLSSMEQNPIPTRAEVSDIFHAVYHGAAAVMVTGETAVGKYPVEVIKYLANTANMAHTNGEIV